MAQNDMVGGGDAFKDALRSKVGDALDTKRQDIASAICLKQNLIVIQNQKYQVQVLLHKMDKLNLQGKCTSTRNTTRNTRGIDAESQQTSTEQQTFNSNAFKNLSPLNERGSK